MMIVCAVGAEGARCAQRAWRISPHLIRFSPFNLITKLITSCGAGVRPSLEGLPYEKSWVRKVLVIFLECPGWVWLVLPLPVGGCKLADHAGESDWLELCDCQWPLALCQWASGFGGAGLRGSPSSESSGVVFLLVGVPALCPVHLSAPLSALAVAAAASSTVRRTQGSSHWHLAAAAAAMAAVRRAAAAAFSPTFEQDKSV